MISYILLLLSESVDGPPALISGLARVHPVVVHVHRFGQKIDRRLVILHTHPAGDPGRVSALVHLNLARLFVVAERAVELLVERFDVLALRRGLSLRLPASHGGL